MILKLIQSPDLECQELLDFLYNGRYQLDNGLLEEFKVTLKVIPTYSLEYFLDIVKSISTLTQAEDGGSFIIGIHSVIGKSICLIINNVLIEHTNFRLLLEKISIGL